MNMVTRKELEDALAYQTLLLKTQLEESISAIRNELIKTLTDEHQKLSNKTSALESKVDVLE